MRTRQRSRHYGAAVRAGDYGDTPANTELASTVSRRQSRRMDLYLVQSGDRGRDAHYCAPPHRAGNCRLEEGAAALKLGQGPRFPSRWSNRTRICRIRLSDRVHVRLMAGAAGLSQAKRAPALCFVDYQIDAAYAYCAARSRAPGGPACRHRNINRGQEQKWNQYLFRLMSQIDTCHSSHEPRPVSATKHTLACFRSSAACYRPDKHEFSPCYFAVSRASACLVNRLEVKGFSSVMAGRRRLISPVLPCFAGENRKPGNARGPGAPRRPRGG